MDFTCNSLIQALNDCMDPVSVRLELINSLRVCPLCKNILPNERFKHFQEHSEHESVEKIMNSLREARDGVKLALANYLAMEGVMQHVVDLPLANQKEYKTIVSSIDTYRLNL